LEQAEADLKAAQSAHKRAEKMWNGFATKVRRLNLWIEDGRPDLNRIISELKRLEREHAEHLERRRRAEPVQTVSREQRLAELRVVMQASHPDKGNNVEMFQKAKAEYDQLRDQK
jgi:hypothetical protein